MSDQCLFCGIVAGDVPGVRVAEDETTYAFMDIHPASDGHLLVVPKRHSTDLCEIPEPTPGDTDATADLGDRLSAALD